MKPSQLIAVDFLIKTTSCAAVSWLCDTTYHASTKSLADTKVSARQQCVGMKAPSKKSTANQLYSTSY